MLTVVSCLTFPKCPKDRSRASPVPSSGRSRPDAGHGFWAGDEEADFLPGDAAQGAAPDAHVQRHLPGGDPEVASSLGTRVVRGSVSREQKRRIACAWGICLFFKILK